MSNTALELRKQQLTTIQKFIDKAMPQLTAALPKLGFTPESLARAAFTTIIDSPHLHGADPKTLVKCLLEANQLGLSLDKNLGHAYLVPFKGKVQLMPGYRGLIALMDRSGLVKDVVAQVVYDGDLFEYEITMERDHLRWKRLAKPEEQTDANLRYAFAIVRLINGGTRHVVLDRDDLLDARNRSASYKQSPNSSPWTSDFAAMCLKTGLRRVSKVAPLSPQLMRAIRHDDDVETGHPQMLAEDFLQDDIIDVLAERADNGEQTTVDKLKEKAAAASPKPEPAKAEEKKEEEKPQPKKASEPKKCACGAVELGQSASRTDETGTHTLAGPCTAPEAAQDNEEPPFEPEPQAQATSTASSQPAGSENSPAPKKRGRPKKEASPAASNAAAEAPAAAPAAKTAEVVDPAKSLHGLKPIGKNLTEDQKMLIPPKRGLENRLGKSEEKLKALSQKVLGYERESFDDVFEREAVAMIAAWDADHPNG